MYDLNQILCDYTVEVTNRFEGKGLIDRVPEELWTEVHNIVQEAVIKTISKKKKCNKAKWLSEEALQIAEKRKARGKGEKERYTHLNAEFQRIARRDKKAFLSDQCKEIDPSPNHTPRVYCNCPPPWLAHWGPVNLLPPSHITEALPLRLQVGPPGYSPLSGCMTGHMLTI